MAPPPRLDPGRRWFVPGLCYSYARFQGSVFQILSKKGAVDVMTLMAPGPLFLPANFQMPRDNWQKTVQGMLISDTMQFLNEIEIVRFRVDGVPWRVRLQSLIVGDPFSLVQTATVFYLLPETETHRLVITQTNGSAAIIERQSRG